MKTLVICKNSYIVGINFPWEMLVTEDLAWEVYKDNTSLNLSPFLYAMITKEVVDFVMERCANYTGARVYYLIVAATSLIKYVGKSYKTDMQRIDQHTAGIRNGLLWITDDIPYHEVSSAYLRHFNIANELVEADEVDDLFFVRLNLGKNLPASMVHEAENNLNSQIYEARSQWHRDFRQFRSTICRNKRSNESGMAFNKFLIDSHGFPCTVQYMADACGFALAAQCILKVMNGDFEHLPIGGELAEELPAELPEEFLEEDLPPEEFPAEDLPPEELPEDEHPPEELPEDELPPEEL